MNEEANENKATSSVLDYVATGLVVGALAFGGYKGYKHLSSDMAKAERKTARDVANKAKYTKENIVKTSPDDYTVEPHPTGEGADHTAPVVNKEPIVSNETVNTENVTETAPPKSDADLLQERENLLKNKNGEYMQSSVDNKNNVFMENNVPLTTAESESYNSVYDNINNKITEFNEFYKTSDTNSEDAINAVSARIKKRKADFDSSDGGFKDANNLLIDSVSELDDMGNMINAFGNDDVKAKFSELNNDISNQLGELNIKKVEVNPNEDITDLTKRKNVEDTHNVSYVRGEGDNLAVDNVIKNAYTKDGEVIRRGEIGINRTKEMFTPEEKEMSFADNFTPAGEAEKPVIKEEVPKLEPTIEQNPDDDRYTETIQKIKDNRSEREKQREKIEEDEIADVKDDVIPDTPKKITPSENIQNTADILTKANNIDPLEVEGRDKGIISYLYGDGEKNSPKIFVNNNVEDLLKTKQVKNMFNNFVEKGLNPDVASKLDPTNPMDMLPLLTAHEVGHHYDISSRLKNGTIEEFAKNQNITRDIQEKAAAAAQAGDTKAFEKYTSMYRDSPNEAFADNFAIKQMNEHYKKMWPEKNWGS